MRNRSRYLAISGWLDPKNCIKPMHISMISGLGGPLFPNWGVVNSSSLHWGVFVGVDFTDTAPESLSASVKFSMDSPDGLHETSTSTWFSMPFPGSSEVASLSLSPPWFDDSASTSGSAFGADSSPDSDSSLPWSPRFGPSSARSSSDDSALDSDFAWIRNLVEFRMRGKLEKNDWMAPKPKEFGFWKLMIVLDSLTENMIPWP